MWAKASLASLGWAASVLLKALFGSPVIDQKHLQITWLDIFFNPDDN
jgi:hypothetical protein